MATLRYDPFRRWGWIPWGLTGRSAQRASIEHCQAPNELVLSVTRRHPVVLVSTVFVCTCVVTVGLATGISVAVIPPAAVFLAWRIWRWRAGTRTLRTISRPDALYFSIHNLIAVRDVTETL